MRTAGSSLDPDRSEQLGAYRGDSRVVVDDWDRRRHRLNERCSSGTVLGCREFDADEEFRDRDGGDGVLGPSLRRTRTEWSKIYEAPTGEEMVTFD
ncbi:MAG: hypothetical protein H0U80_06685 [Solirubrobacterales bacterium]|nr:hypothetical protein [Solirubrobacterales bacterium]